MACGAYAGAAEPASSSSSATASVGPSPLVSDWTQDVLNLLGLIYQLIGGTAGELSSDTLVAMSQVTLRYTVHGFPPNLTNEEKVQGRQGVEAAFELTGPGQLEGSVTVTAFRLTLKSLYADLGGDPGSL